MLCDDPGPGRHQACLYVGWGGKEILQITRGRGFGGVGVKPPKECLTGVECLLGDWKDQAIILRDEEWQQGASMYQAT